MKTNKKTRRGFAGDVTENKDYQEEVLKSEDNSYVVEDTDSPEEITEESEVITDDHEVVIDEETGTEEDFVAEAEDGEAEEIDEEEISDEREGRRGKRIGKRRGVRKSRIGRKRLGESEDEEVEELIMNEDGDTEEVELPEPDEEDRRGRRGKRHGSRKGEADPFEEMFEVQSKFDTKSDVTEAFKKEGLPGLVVDISSQSPAGQNICESLARKWGCSVDAAEIVFDTVVNGDGYLGGRKGSRKGNIYGGKSPEHQESIRAAVSVAMKDRRL